jgi:hypothetical protein
MSDLYLKQLLLDLYLLASVTDDIGTKKITRCGRKLPIGVIFEVQSQEMMQRKLFLLLPLSPVNWGLLMECIPPICLHLCGKHLRTCRINHSTINNAPYHWYSGHLLNWCKEHSYNANFKLGITEGNNNFYWICICWQV